MRLTRLSASAGKSSQEPEDKTDAAAWAKSISIQSRPPRLDCRGFTDSREVQREEWVRCHYLTPGFAGRRPRRTGRLPSAYFAAYQQPQLFPNLRAAWFLVDHNWQPAGVFHILRDSEQTDPSVACSHVWAIISALSRRRCGLRTRLILRQSAAVGMCWLRQPCGQPAEAQRFKPFIERELPANSWPPSKRNIG